eukprot:CAMPEP_0177794360 /NCGR_PEP_ID=MMETSP0491_2-20121128/25605_1 /TAXON_ID=63592 /ORGANISM="Tetraselmis chuii, Strain PLY429" /LENGTH=49 /DNA_ID=CAMNT_0019317013 /DNA_START=1 /DNA_END=150 /DNA_ORIENTATION=-
MNKNEMSVNSLAHVGDEELKALGVAPLAHRQRIIAAAKYCCLIMHQQQP